jgi:TetR/AcrR family transcriptional regulator, upper aerobic nicotinate degradation pathway regulator
MAANAKTAKPLRRAGAKRPAVTVAANVPARRKRDPEGMQRKILDAATDEFANHGYGGARIERISRRARTVDRMLYYYFGSKEKLFRAVLEGAYERIGRAEAQLDLASTPPIEAMRELIAFTWEYYCAHPEFIRLLNSENQHRGQHLKRSTRLSQLSFPLLSTLRDLLSRGGRAGEFRSDVDPIQIYITIAALGYFYLSNRYTLSRFLDRDLMTEDNRRTWLAHITDVVMDHITTTGRTAQL